MVMGKDEWLLNRLSTTVAKAPQPICKAPINAEALPAFLEKGAIERAEEFGKLKPKQHKKINIQPIVSYKPSQPCHVPSINTKEITD